MYLRYYNLEKYLSDVVEERFRNEGMLGAFDFFCIIIWKANRSKSRVAALLKAKNHATLDGAVSALCNALTFATDRKERMRVLIEEWKFRLPIASAILTVLCPEEFTVYDFRVCEVLLKLNSSANFRYIADQRPFETMWNSYERFLACVRTAAPAKMTLRDKDRYLWGKSLALDLERDIKMWFPKKTKPTQKE